MGIKSLGNTVASFDNYEVRTGNDASNATNHGFGGYSKGCIFDFDPGRLTGYNSNDTIANGTNLAACLDYTDTAAQGLTGGVSISIAAGSFRWSNPGSGAGGGNFIADGSNQGLITISGNGSPVSLGGDEGLLDSPSLSIETWMQYDGSGRDVLVSRFGGSYPNQFNHIVDPNGQFHFNSSGVGCGAGDKPLNAFGNNVWFHCVWTYTGNLGGPANSGVHRWYTNNVLRGSESAGTSLMTDNTTGFSIASRSDDFERLEGRIGTVRLYNKALSATEIATRWNATKARYGL